PARMTLPLWVLAVGSIVAGWIGVPSALGHPIGIPNVWERWLEPVIPEKAASPMGHGIELLMAVVSVAWALLAIGVATRFYRSETPIPNRIASSLGPF